MIIDFFLFEPLLLFLFSSHRIDFLQPFLLLKFVHLVKVERVLEDDFLVMVIEVVVSKKRRFSGLTFKEILYLAPGTVGGLKCKRSNLLIRHYRLDLPPEREKCLLWKTLLFTFGGQLQVVRDVDHEKWPTVEDKVIVVFYLYVDLIEVFIAVENCCVCCWTEVELLKQNFDLDFDPQLFEILYYLLVVVLLDQNHRCIQKRTLLLPHHQIFTLGFNHRFTYARIRLTAFVIKVALFPSG